MKIREQANICNGEVEVQAVSHQYSDDKWALRDVDLRLGTGVTALVGVNGAGKSTLLSMLAGALPPSVGTVRVNDQDVYGRKRNTVLSRIALMPQSLVMPETLTALEVVSVIGWMRGLGRRQVRTRAEAALEAVDLQDRSGSRIKELSGGMRRRVALAQALVGEPDVLLLDEPSTGLDPRQRRRMVDIVRSLVGTVLFSSHVMEDVSDTASRVLVLHDGRILFDGDLARLDALAPADAGASRRAEAAFLQVISASDERTR